MSNSNLFKLGLKKNYKFSSPKGELDLLQVINQDEITLDAIYGNLEEQINKIQRKSLSSTKNDSLKDLENKRDIIIELYNDCQEEKNKINEEKEKERLRKKLLSSIKKDEDSQFDNLSYEEKIKMLEELDK